MGLRRQGGGDCDRSDPADEHRGDHWDPIAFDPGHRPVVSVVPGARTIGNTEALVEGLRRRAGGRLMNPVTSDDYPADETAILHAYGETITPPRTGEPGRPGAPHRAPPPGLAYATVPKRREKGRVVEVGTRAVSGTAAAVLLAPGMAKVSRAIDTAFAGREDGTDRHRDARKARKTDRFSKDWRYREAVTDLTLCSDNFRWPLCSSCLRGDTAG